MGRLSPPELLTAEHDVSGFQSREPELDEWLRRRAPSNEASGASRTYVVCAEKRVVGFYCLSTGAVAHAQASRRVRRNMPDPVPVVVLGRLAVDKDWEGQGIGPGLVNDAILRTLQASDVIGVRAILANAKSERSRVFFKDRCGLTESPVSPMTLMISLADARAALARL